MHFPTLPHPDFAGKTGAGDIGDAMAEMDRNVGVILDTIAQARHRAGHDRDLGERRRGGGQAPVAGHRRTVARLLQHRHGGRHPDAVHDPLARTHSRRAACRTRSSTGRTCSRRSRTPSAPRCRRTARSTASTSCRSSRASRRQSNRDSFIYFAPGNQVRAVKWGDWKLHYAWQDEPGTPGAADDEAVQPAVGSQGGDRRQGLQPVGRRARSTRSSAEFWTTVDRYPLIPVGAPDPYTPSLTAR